MSALPNRHCLFSIDNGVFPISALPHYPLCILDTALINRRISVLIYCSAIICIAQRSWCLHCPSYIPNFCIAQSALPIQLWQYGIPNFCFAQSALPIQHWQCGVHDFCTASPWTLDTALLNSHCPFSIKNMVFPTYALIHYPPCILNTALLSRHCPFGIANHVLPITALLILHFQSLLTN